MFKRASKNQAKATKLASYRHTPPVDSPRPSTPDRRTPTSRSNLTSKSEIAPHRKSRRYKLTKEDFEFIKLYTKHFPPALHRVRPPNRFKRKRKRTSETSESGQAQNAQGAGASASAGASAGASASADADADGRNTPRSYLQQGHTYELAEALCKLKERPLASGLQGKMRLIGALRKLDQDRECTWKCWMRCAMRREAEHINNMRLSIINTRAQNLQEVGPEWYQQLSWEQMETVNKLEMTLYHDIDEGTTNRTQCLLRVLGVEQPPSHRIIKCIMQNSKDDPCKFLIELYRIMSTTGRLPGEDTSDEEETGENDDEEDERWGRGKYRTGFEYSLDERLILSSLAHLRIGSILHSLNEKFGKPNTRLPYFRMVLPPCGERRKKPSSATTWPYLQPLYIPEYNWLEPKMIQDAIYAQNLYMTLHRVPPPVPPQLRPVPYTHIEIPDYLKPRRYKSRKQKFRLSQPTSGSEDTGTKTDMSNNSSRSHLTDEAGTKKYRLSRSSGTVEDDTVSMNSKSFSKKSNRRGFPWKCRRSRPSVVQKPRRKLLASWLKKMGETSKLRLDEGTPRCSTPITNHPTKSVLKPHRSAKEECSCDCKEKQVAEKGGRDFGSPYEESDDTNKGLIDELDVMGFLPTVPDEPLVKFTNPQELPAIQKWIRMKNGLIYIHPVIASKLYKRSRALWNILEGGRCSMIHSPELCLTKTEERSLTWDHHAWFRRESARVVDEYYRTCFEMQIALAREFYPSMATDYLRNRDKFLQIYFVYLPARPQDCLRRPWKKSEYNREIYTRWKQRFQDTLEAKQKENDRPRHFTL